MPRSQHAVSPKQPDQPQMERQYRLAIDDFDKLKSPPSKSYETNPIPFSNTREARERSLRNEPNSSLPAPRTSRSQPPPLSNTRQAPARDLRNEPNFGPNSNEMKPLALLRNEPNSPPPAPRTSRSQPAPHSNTWKAHERDLRNEPNFAPNPNKMKPLAPFAKRTQFPPGPRFPSPRTKLIATAMPASQPL